MQYILHIDESVIPIRLLITINFQPNIVNRISGLLLGRKKFTLVAHDWGAVIGWDFVTQHMEMLDKYIMMDAPSRRIAFKLLMSTKEQFKMSWYGPSFPNIF